MAQAAAADSRDQPSSNSAIASIRRDARASCVRAAATRKSASVRSKRVIATVIAVPLLSLRNGESRRIASHQFTFESAVLATGIRPPFVLKKSVLTTQALKQRCGVFLIAR